MASRWQTDVHVPAGQVRHFPGQYPQRGEDRGPSRHQLLFAGHLLDALADDGDPYWAGELAEGAAEVDHAPEIELSSLA